MSSEVTTDALKLPSRKTYLTALSTVTFFSGLGIATVITIRRGRRMKLEEIAAQSEKGFSASHNGAPLKDIKPVKEDTLIGSASAKGPITLFREMNRAAFGKRSLNESQLSRPRGATAKASVFDSSAGFTPPSALMKVSPKGKAADGMMQEPPKEINHREPPSTAGVSRSDLGESPVIMAVKAIGIATGLLGVGAYVAWEITRRVLDVRNIDEFIDRLSIAVPSRAKDKQTLSSFGGTARASLKQPGILNGEDIMIAEELNEKSASVPLPVHEALQALDDAASRGDVSTWMNILSRQLNAEREQDLEQRRQRRARQYSNIKQSPVLV